ncbi:MAG: hypothetical protein E6I88_09370 [Chloroflexi bacterium]|nr:MAG: hypothetical protein E6I88_09370 [Chloroflexota bacterium]
MPSEVWLLGNPVMGSRSPSMQNAAFRVAGIDCRYLPRELSNAELAGVMTQMRENEQVLGANVTIPHKQAVLPLLDSLDPLAWRVGAVNTISRRNGRLLGSNTDVVGFSRALDDCGYVVECKSVLLIGAGGAARAVGEALRTRAATLMVVAREPERCYLSSGCSTCGRDGRPRDGPCSSTRAPHPSRSGPASPRRWTSCARR